MSWNSAPACPICGNAHEDGVSVEIDGKVLFICFDCAEDVLENPDADTELEAELDL